ncbi:hypothetical protein, partial [Klebsiella phage vB_KpnM_TU02]
NVYSSYSLI